MNNLTSGKRAFINKMKVDEKFARWGFEKLALREDLLDFFSPLYEEGLFDAKLALGVEPGDKEGSYRIPYWPALTYLEKVSEKIGELEDNDSAELIIEIIHQISSFKDQEGKPKDNYHTWYSFTQILSYLPLKNITNKEIDLLDIWLDSGFDSSLVGGEIGKALLPKLLASEEKGDHEKAVNVIGHVTQLKIIQDGKYKKIVTAVESYWLKYIFEKNTALLAKKCGLLVLKILRACIEKLIGLKGYDSSYNNRPAIEDHEQNKYREGTLNDLITAYRDVMDAVVQNDSEQVGDELSLLLSSKLFTNRRIAYHIIDKYFDSFSQFFLQDVKADMFVNEVHHELYLLLQNHFSGFSSEDKKKVLTAIKAMPQKSYNVDDEAEALLYHQMDQRHWLHAIKGLGCEDVDSFYHELSSGSKLGKVSEHPEFLIYSESSWGSGPSAYSVTDLILAIRTNPDDLVEKLNSFEETGGWKKPTVRALTNTLTAAVKKEPIRFIGALPKFLSAFPPYQYAIITGIKDMWESGGDLDWCATLQFCWGIIKPDQFWKVVRQDDNSDGYTGNPDSSWIPASIADLIRSGLTNDDHAIPPELMPMIQQIMDRLLQQSPSSTEVSDDAMSTAINSRKGRCLELLFSFALRSSRLEEQSSSSHEKSWHRIEPVFERELSLCKNGNFEFSTLCGSYLPNISYLNKEWLDSHVGEIFSNEYEGNFQCAVEGLAYIQQFYRDIYIMLKGQGVLEKALQIKSKNHYVREKLIQFIAVAFLNDEESLENKSSLMYLVAHQFNEDDISELAGFFWMQRDVGLDEEKQQKILAFWQYCSSKIKGKEDSYKKLLSKLSLLTVFVSDMTEKSSMLIYQVAPYADEDYNTTFFLEYMNILAKSHPEEIGRILITAINHWRVFFDSRGVFDILNTLIDLGDVGIEQAKRICNLENVRELSGIQELYEKLDTNSA